MSNVLNNEDIVSPSNIGIESDIDEPFDKEQLQDELIVEKISPEEREEREKRRQDKRYYTAFRLIVGCLIFLGIIYLIEVISSGVIKHDLAKSTNNIIEIIKTLLFTLSGYLFARKESGSD